MKSKNLLKTNVLVILLAIVLVSCGPTQQSGGEEKTEAPKLTLTKAPASPAYEDASLALTSSEITEGDSSFSASFNFDVQNYELGVQTEGSDTRGIANSGKGQHIHFIVNNGPYSAHYDAALTKEFKEAGYYTIIAFLSRSYHESVKNPNAYYVDHIKVGEPDGESTIDFSAKHMFYSRPKGTYKGSDTEKLMIDFYLLNTTLSPEGDKVKATVNGQEFIIEEWAPYYVEGLPKGTATVKLELIDAEGNAIPGPFNVVEREVTLE